MNQTNDFQHFIIGGTIKAATTSLFNYLNAHPEICGSKVKETYFYSQGFTGQSDKDFKKYSSYFTPQADTKILFEASPNYLAYKENVAPRIRQLFPETKLLFILRNPVQRLYSYYNFAKGKLQIPQSMSFEEFVVICEKFNSGLISPEQAGIVETHLRALEIGNYGNYLQNFYEEFEPENVKVIFFDDVNKYPVETLENICEFIGVDATFYKSYTMNRANVTFSARIKTIHYLVLLLNRTLESVFRRYPSFKQFLVKVYKFFNKAQRNVVPMQAHTREKLTNYYKPSNAKVKDLLIGQTLPDWIDSC